MPEPDQHQDLLVIRPWLSNYSIDSVFGHFDALVMRRHGTAPPQHYCHLEPLRAGDDERKALLLDGFRFECQIDERQADPYAWRWGYRPAYYGMFTASDLARFGKSITAIDRALKRLWQEDGPPETAGHHVVRLANILRVDGIVMLETSVTGTFEGHLAIRHGATAPVFGDTISSINGLARELQAACAARVARWAGARR